MTGSRIWLDLSGIFSCSRKQSCVYIDHEKLRTVKDVQDHICRLFDLKRAIQVLNDGWLLPSSESSLLFRDNDTVSVVPEDVPEFSVTVEKAIDAPAVSKCKEVNGLFKSPPKSVVASVVPSKPITANGNSTMVSEESTVKKNSRLNPFADIQPQAKNKPVVEPPCEKNTVAHETLSTPPVLEDDETASEVGSESKKRKRIRRRKKKSATGTNDDQTPKETKLSHHHSNRLFQSISYTLNTAMAQNNATVKDTVNPSNKRKHIFFDDPGVEEMKKISSTEDPKTVNRLFLSGEPKDVKKICLTEEPKDGEGIIKTEEPIDNAKDDKTSQISPIISSPARGDGAIGLAKLMSLGNQKSPAVFERKKADNSQMNGVDSNVLVPEQKIMKLKLLPLNELPVKETTIQFKVLKMVNYSPVVSEPITARVISPDVPNKQVYVQIKEGLSELLTEKGKFSLDLDETLNDEVPLGEYLYLDWQDLLEPKAVVYV